jgi:hypothetical protein
MEIVVPSNHWPGFYFLPLNHRAIWDILNDWKVKNAKKPLRIRRLVWNECNRIMQEMTGVEKHYAYWFF